MNYFSDLVCQKSHRSLAKHAIDGYAERRGKSLTDSSDRPHDRRLTTRTKIHIGHIEQRVSHATTGGIARADRYHNPHTLQRWRGLTSSAWAAARQLAAAIATPDERAGSANAQQYRSDPGNNASGD